jgi:hypothetical protein
VEYPKGLHGKEGDSIPWVVQVEEERELVYQDCCENEQTINFGNGLSERIRANHRCFSLWTHSLSSGVACCRNFMCNIAYGWVECPLSTSNW